MAFNKKPKVHHLRTFGCPAVFKRFEFSKDGKRTVNKYTQQGMRGIFVGIPDDSAGWLFYVSDLKQTYISMDASFDEGFTSPMILPDLPFGGALRLRTTTARNNYDNSNFEATGTSVDIEESYPQEHGLPMPLQQYNNEEETPTDKRGVITQSQTTSQTDSQKDDSIHAYFTTMSTGI